MALTSQVTLTNTDGTTASTYAYDAGGRLVQVALTGGARPRTVSLTTDLAGQILTRDESSAASLNPHARNYFFAGVEQGGVGNDGTDNQTFAAAAAAGTVAPTGHSWPGSRTAAAHLQDLQDARAHPPVIHTARCRLISGRCGSIAAYASSDNQNSAMPSLL